MNKEDSVAAGYATAPGAYQEAQGRRNLEAPPYLNEIDFTNRYKEKLFSNITRKNMPHMKRVLNNQVFLEETENYVPTDD